MVLLFIKDIVSLDLLMIFSFQEKSEQLEQKLEMRRKQFHVLISSIHSLQATLDESDEEITPLKKSDSEYIGSNRNISHTEVARSD